MSLEFLKRLIPAPIVRRAQSVLFHKLGLKWTLPTGIRLQVLSRTDWTLYNDIFVDGEYDKAIDALIHRLSTDAKALVVDLGANVGFFGLRLFHMLSSAGICAKQLQVFAVEPSTANLDELRGRLRQQGEWSDCTIIVPGLVGEKKLGAATLFESHNYGMNTLIDGIKYPGAKPITTTYVDLDRILPEGEPVHLLKCDIEGSELAFVQNYGSLLCRVQIAVFEVHHNVCDVEHLKRLLDLVGLSDERIIVNRGNTSIRLFTRVLSQS